MTRPRILFVDDDPSVLAALKRSFRRRVPTWDMTFCERSRDAVASHRVRPFDVVVSDLAMPDLDGLAMVMEMKKAPGDAVYIMLTGTADLTAAVEAINQAEVFRFFTKPCPAELLAEGIAAGLAARESHGSGSEGLTQAIGIAALNQLAVAVIVAERSGRVLLTNRAGGAMLAEADGLSLSAGEILRAATPLATAKLLAAIADACSGRDSEVAMSLDRPSEKRPLLALAMPLEFNEREPLAAIYVNDGERSTLPEPEALSKLFGLSVGEARLARALAEGLRLEDAAEACGLTISTARTYIKQAFAKTGTSRQAELVKLILTTPPVS